MEKNNLATQKAAETVNQGASSSNKDSAYGKDIKGDIINNHPLLKVYYILK